MFWVSNAKRVKSFFISCAQPRTWRHIPCARTLDREAKMVMLSVQLRTGQCFNCEIYIYIYMVIFQRVYVYTVSQCNISRVIWFYSWVFVEKRILKSLTIKGSSVACAIPKGEIYKKMIKQSPLLLYPLWSIIFFTYADRYLPTLKTTGIPPKTFLAVNCPKYFSIFCCWQTEWRDRMMQQFSEWSRERK